MKILIQKIPLVESQSFVCRIYETPHFETSWHKHYEHELIIIKKGSGTAMIGDYVSEYEPGDTFFLASNMPHWFRKSDAKMVGAALVLQFSKDLFGKSFIELPELKHIHDLLEQNKAIMLLDELKADVADFMEAIEHEKGLERVLLLMHCLEKICHSQEQKVLSQNFSDSNSKNDSAIDQIMEYSFKKYLGNITLNEVAASVNMSIPTFCRFFKKNIKKSYFDFIRDLRIGHACKLLIDTPKPVLEICYESGYQSWPHFSKQFKQVKATTPLKYRKQFMK